MKTQEEMQRELDDAAIAAAAADSGRDLHDAYCVRRRVGGKIKRYVLEQEADNDDMADALELTAGDQQRARGQLWVGHDMTKACPDGSMVGTVNFLGLEYEFIDYLLEFDRRNVQQVQTAYGLSTDCRS